MKKHVLWMIYNAGKLKGTFERDLTIDEEDITLCFGNYSDLNGFPLFYREWIQDKILNFWGMSVGRDPAPMDCFYIYTKSEIETDKLVEVTSQCLRLSFPPPTMISIPPGVHIEKAVLCMPCWEPRRNGYSIVNDEVDGDKVDELISLIVRFSQKSSSYYPQFEQIFRVAAIDDVLIEILSLWAFIEGFWNDNSDQSDLERSFKNMLNTDLFPDASTRREPVRVIRKLINEQNNILGAANITKLRNIIAHGWYVSLCDTWSAEQWKAIREQRHLLLDMVLKALIERTLRDLE